MSLIPAHRGYRYQDIAAAVLLARCIVLDAGATAILDRKEHGADRFDDVTLNALGSIVRRQIKSSTSAATEWTVEDFATDKRNLRIDYLANGAMQDAGFLRTRYVASSPFAISPAFRPFLTPAPQLTPVIAASAQSWRLNLHTLWPADGEPAWEALHDFDRAKFAAFADRFTIEAELPSASLDLHVPGPLEHALFAILVDDIGVGTYPNRERRAEDVAAALIDIAYQTRTGTGEIAVTEAVRRLALRTDYGRVAQRFPIIKTALVERTALIDRFIAFVRTQPATALIGPPGAGKSWLLTEAADTLAGDSALVARHYCYLEPGDEEVQRRVTTDALFANLVAEIIDQAPDLADAVRPRFGAGPRELEMLLAAAAEAEPERPVILMIDGLDHISRVIETASSIARDDTAIVDELALLSLPPSVRLVVASQPGAHLDPIRDQITVFTMPPWAEGEIGMLAERLGVPAAMRDAGFDSNDDLDDMLQALAARAEGNPLYGTFLCRTIITHLEQDGAAPIEVLSATPAIDGDISKYYAFLLPPDEHVARALADVLAFVEFGLTPDELRTIYPAHAPYVAKALGRLEPVLRRVTSQGGIRLYHESLRRFVASQAPDGPLAAAGRILPPVITWLESAGLFASSRAYRFLLPLLARSGRSVDIAAHVRADFVERSVANGHAPTVIQANLALSLNNAAESDNWPAVIRTVELERARRTFVDRMRHGALLRRYGTAYIALFGAHALAERLMFDGKPTHDREPGLVLCSLCDDAGATPPWREYLRLAADDDSRDPDDVAGEAVFHGFLRVDPIGAVDALAHWLDHDLEPERFRHAFAVIARAVLLTDPNTVLDGGAALTGPRRALLALGIAQAVGNTDPARAVELLASVSAHDCPPTLLDRFADLTGRHAEAQDVAFDVSEVARVVPDGRRFGAAETAAWLASIRLAARLAPEKLAPAAEALAGGGWGHAWLRFALAIAQLEIIVEPAVRDEAILRALAELRDAESHPDPFALNDVAPAIHRTLERALHLISSSTAFHSAVDILTALSRATQSHFQGGSMGALVTEDLIDVLLPYVADVERVESILPAVLARVDVTEAYGEFYETHAEHDLQMAHIYAQIGRREDAEARWSRAATHLTAYGWRRDITAYEPIESLEVIAEGAPLASQARLVEAQVLAENVVAHTDGKDTRNILNYWFNSLLRTDPARAIDLVAQSIWASDGGVDWRIERAFEAVANALGTTEVHPLLASHVQASARADGAAKSVSARGPVVQRLATAGYDAAPYVTILAGAMTGDAPAVETGAVNTITASAQTHGVSLPPIGSRRNPRYSEPSSPSPRPLAQQITEPLPHTARELVLAVHRGPFFSFRDDPAAVERYAQQLGYRLLGLEDDVAAIRVLRVFARAAYYSGGDDVLTILGEGFARHGRRPLAAAAHALAYAYTRPNWSVFGSRDTRARFAAATDIDANLAHSVLRAEAMWFFAKYGGSAGLTQHPIELFVALGDLERALAIYDASVEVIRRRLPLPTAGYRPFVRYDPSQEAPPFDASVASLLVARTLHPEHQRKVAALAGIASAIQTHTEAIVAPLAAALPSAPLTLQLAFLNILDAADDDGVWCVHALAPTLRGMTASAYFGVRTTAHELLDRIRDTAERASPAPATETAEQTIATEAVAALASIDRRVETLELLVPGSAEAFAHLADMEARDEERKDRSRERSRLLYNRGLERFPDNFLYDHEEIVEELLHRTAGMLLGERRDGAAQDVAGFLAPRIERDIANWFSRTPRPTLERPCGRTAGRVSPSPIEDPVYPGWYRIGYYERELLLSTAPFRKIVGTGTVMSGVQLHPGGSASREACFVNGDRRQRDTSVFLTSMHAHRGAFGPVLLLLPAQELVERLRLVPAGWTQPFIARDRSGIAVAFRQWRHEPLGEDLNEEEPVLRGCDLLLRPDLYRTVYAMAAGWVSDVVFTKVVSVEGS